MVAPRTPLGIFQEHSPQYFLRSPSIFFSPRLRKGGVFSLWGFAGVFNGEKGSKRWRLRRLRNFF